MTPNEAKLVAQLLAVTISLQTHVREEAHRRHCTPSEYCPCTDNELARALALLGEFGVKPTY